MDIWSELISPDVGESRNFYSALLGWTAHDAQAGDSAYTLFRKDGKEIAGLMAPPNADTPAPMWFTYITVDDVDATVAMAEKLGGKVLQPAFDVPQVGRGAVIADSTGAAVGLFQHAEDSTAPGAP